MDISSRNMRHAMHASSVRAIVSIAAAFGRASAVAAMVLLALIAPVTYSPAGTAHAGELVKNGSFETGDFGPYWVHGAYRNNNYNPIFADHVVVPDMPFTGSYSARLGFKYSRERKSAVGYMYQDVTIPVNISSARLFFQVRQQGFDIDPFDPFAAQIRNTNDDVLENVLGLTFTEPEFFFKDTGWIADDGTPPQGFDLTAYAGQSVRLYFEQANTNDHYYETWVYIDDVSVVYRRFVDLFVDGVGDDEFGVLGSGDGGHSDKSCLAGQQVSFVFDVENEGVDVDSYSLSANVPAGWSVLIDDNGSVTGLPYVTETITAGQIKTYTLLVDVPPGASAGSYDITIDAVSTSHGNRYDSVRLGVGVVEAVYGVDVVVDGNGFGTTGDDGNGGFALKVAPWDVTTGYSLEVINTGDSPAAFQVLTTTDPGANWTIWYEGTAYAAPFTTLVLPAGAVAAMSLDVTVPYPEPGADYRTVVSAVAVPDSLKRDSIEAVLRLKAPWVDMIVGANGDDIYDDTFSGLGGSSTTATENGTVVTFPVTIQNESSFSDSFEVSWDRPKGNWSAVLNVGGTDYSLPHTTAGLAPNSQIDAEFKITIPGNAKMGTYPCYLHAVSLIDSRISESITAAVSITNPGQVDMIIDGNGAGVYGPLGTGLGGSSLRSAAAGDTVVFSIQLQNLSGANSIDVWWSTPAGWDVTFDGQSSPISGYAAGTYDLRVIVPAYATGGTFDIIVDAQKSDRVFYMDSVVGRVHVLQPRVVDAIIDGNGDGVFGGVGTGLGGASAQITSAPSTISFTVELQNESTEFDRYTMSWNDIPFWQSTINGLAGPYTTGSIGPGSFDLFAFDVTIPAWTIPGDYWFVIDVVSVTDPNVVESIEARVTVAGPPRADLIIDGDGAGVFGAIGSGDGGLSLQAVNAGGSFVSLLELRNVGSFADSFHVSWELPVGWPVGSITLNDGMIDHTGPFWTSIIGAADVASFTVNVNVPAGAGAGSFTTIINTFSSLLPGSPESVRLIAQTVGVITGVVFDDQDHDGVIDPSEAGIGGVRLTETGTGLVEITGGDGRFVFEIAGGTSATIIEQVPSGFIPITADSVGPLVLSAGDTIVVNFANVSGIRLSPGVVINGIAGGYVDFPHRLDAGTSGPVTVAAQSDSGVTTVLYLDENENGVFDGVDRVLLPGDLDMDPTAGRDHVALLVRAYVPASSPVGSAHQISIQAVQVITGTTLTANASAIDAVVVVDANAGRLTLAKHVDNATAAPGDVLTYTITFANSGADSVRNVLIIDPISPYVDPLVDAFGPGMDVEWQIEGAPARYLTLDSGDADECEYTIADRMIRLITSKNSPIFLRPGETGTLTYKAIVK
ncbi:MAG: DUF11 domain-containing protein [Candidatus Latescibacterota bacterium]|nr:MAG: DUF11 domain-containing protein [Candidatus Latescibacterota bacterium]